MRILKKDNSLFKNSLHTLPKKLEKQNQKSTLFLFFRQMPSQQLTRLEQAAAKVRTLKAASAPMVVMIEEDTMLIFWFVVGSQSCSGPICCSYGVCDDRIFVFFD
jgi:hypothetical protein